MTEHKTRSYYEGGMGIGQWDLYLIEANILPLEK